MYGFRGSIKDQTIDKKGYKTLPGLRRETRKYLQKNNLVLDSYYEYKVTKNGFIKISERNFKAEREALNTRNNQYITS